MRLLSVAVALVVLSAFGSPMSAQPIIAQNSGISNPDHVITFGANLYLNFTPITTQFSGIVVAHASYFTTGVATNLVGGFLTNDGSGSPDTLRIVFASPIQDLSFVYHQVGTFQSSIFRAMLGGSVVDSFTNFSTQSQLNNYFGFQNIVFDELQIDFVADFNLDTLAYNDVNASCSFRNGSGINPAAYNCTSLPVLGTNWTSVITTTPNTVTTLIAIALGGGHPGIPYLGGEILVQLTPDLIFIETPGSYAIAVPNFPFLLGQSITAQGVRVEAIGPAQIAVLLNAVDLVLGV